MISCRDFWTWSFTLQVVMMSQKLFSHGVIWDHEGERTSGGATDFVESHIPKMCASLKESRSS